MDQRWIDQMGIRELMGEGRGVKSGLIRVRPMCGNVSEARIELIIIFKFSERDFAALI